MKDNMRMANPIEDLVHRTDSPFTASINGHLLPSKFKLPSLVSYDGTRDPFDHIATFKTTMHLQGVLDEIMCRAFPTTLKGPARVWFSKIPPNSVSSFEELSKLFVNNFIGKQRHKWCALWKDLKKLTSFKSQGKRTWKLIPQQKKPQQMNPWTNLMKFSICQILISQKYNRWRAKEIGWPQLYHTWKMDDYQKRRTKPRSWGWDRLGTFLLTKCYTREVFLNLILDAWL